MSVTYIIFVVLWYAAATGPPVHSDRVDLAVTGQLCSTVSSLLQLQKSLLFVSNQGTAGKSSVEYFLLVDCCVIG